MIGDMRMPRSRGRNIQRIHQAINEVLVRKKQTRQKEDVCKQSRQSKSNVEAC